MAYERGRISLSAEDGNTSPAFTRVSTLQALETHVVDLIGICFDNFISSLRQGMNTNIVIQVTSIYNLQCIFTSQGVFEFTPVSFSFDSKTI